MGSHEYKTNGDFFKPQSTYWLIDLLHLSFRILNFTVYITDNATEKNLIKKLDSKIKVLIQEKAKSLQTCFSKAI